MAISKSRLGRGLGNLIAGGISNPSQPAKPAAKQAASPAASKPAPASGKNKPQAQKASAPVKGKQPAATAKPAPAKPVAKPAVKPVAKPAAKPIAKPATKPVAKPTAPKPVSKPVSKPVAALKGKAQPVKPVSAKPAAATPAAPVAPAPAPAVAAAATSAPSPVPAAKTAAAPSAVAPTAATNVASTPVKPVAEATTSNAVTSLSPATPSSAAAAQEQTQAHAVAEATAQSAAAKTTFAETTPQPLPAQQSGGSHAGSDSSKPATEAAATAITPSAAAAAGSSNSSPYREIPVNAVVPNPYQPRREMSPEHIAELADSIASEGLLQPIVVRPLDGGKGYELIAGERRWRAHQKLGLRVIAARVMNASDSSSAVISLIENIQRQALNPIEEALGFASLMRDFDLTQEAVSERIGRARASIANTLRLLALDREIQGYVAKGILSVGHAKILLGLEEPAQRLLIARRIIESGLSVRETEALVQRLKNEKHSRGNGGTSAVSEADRTAIADLEKQLSSKLNTRVFLKHAPKKGRIVIEYHGNEDLQRILERTGLQL